MADSENNEIQKLTVTVTGNSPPVTTVTVASFSATSGTPPSFFLPEGVAVYGNSLYVADTLNDRVVELTTAGVPVTAWGGSGDGNSKFNSPIGMAVNSNATTVYVGDYGNNRVQAFGPTGNYLSQFGNGVLSGPEGVAADGNGSIFVVDTGSQEIKVFGP